MKAKNKGSRKKRVTDADAIALHAEANKSDPFAARRMSMTLREGHDTAEEVAKESKRILDARQASINEAFRAWKAEQEPVTLGAILGSELTAQRIAA